MPLPTLASLSLRSVAPTAVRSRVVIDSDEEDEEVEERRRQYLLAHRNAGYQTWVVPARTPSEELEAELEAEMDWVEEEEAEEEEEEEAPCEERLRAAVAHIDHLEQELAEERERVARMERRVYGESSSSGV